jgi:hypothetical protein
VGTTRREEVSKKLASIDTGYSNPRLFWGRWAVSKWGYWWMVGAPCAGNCLAGDAKRIWHAHNLLITFDETGIVQNQQIIDDDTALWRELHAQMGKMPPLDLSKPLTISSASYREKMIVLTNAGMKITGYKTRPQVAGYKAKPYVRISPVNVIGIRHVGTADKKAHPGLTCHTLQLVEKSAFGKNIRFCAEPPQLMTLFQYLEQNAPSGMRWE